MGFLPKKVHSRTFDIFIVINTRAACHLLIDTIDYDLCETSSPLSKSVLISNTSTIAEGTGPMDRHSIQ